MYHMPGCQGPALVAKIQLDAVPGFGRNECLKRIAKMLKKGEKEAVAWWSRVKLVDWREIPPQQPILQP